MPRPLRWELEVTHWAARFFPRLAEGCRGRPARETDYPGAVKFRRPFIRSIRASLAGSVACLAVLLILVGHDARPLLEPGHAHDAAMVAGLCFVAVGTLAVLLGASPSPRPATVVPRLVPAIIRLRRDRPPDGRARTSPASLQRFRN
jgi:hypothetical protein